ncbi:L-seryl-tRNA(Sec) selenium transferase [bacterium HR26]|nr:L-seryl-tRNA(Sec) selenium transferase [bacterium HR26]
MAEDVPGTPSLAGSEPEKQQRLRQIPSISAILAYPELEGYLERFPNEVVTQVAQQVVGRVRAAILSGTAEVDPDQIIDAVRRELDQLEHPRLTPLINGTGVIIHTNLGRAPVSAEAARAMALAASRYTPLELELDSGRRGGRMVEISRLLRLLVGAESSLVVNNNAAAVLLVLSALCAGREVIVSRSQSIEIGGGFRIPEVLAQSGARLVEVGTTNRTYVRDYAAAITSETAAILSVHWSNFRIVGFTAQPALAELAELAHQRGLILIEDLGSGALLDTAPFGLAHEPTVGEALSAGVDIVCFSGDKLLGGPQAGIISGKWELVSRVAAHPLARAVRADKTALAGIAATLRHYLYHEALAKVPVWQMISTPLDQLEARCRSWLAQLGHVPGLAVVESQATVGGGSLPGETLPSRALAIPEAVARAHGLTLDQLAHRLRTGRPAVMPRVESGRLLIDARTVLPDQDGDLVQALRQAVGRGGA